MATRVTGAGLIGPAPRPPFRLPAVRAGGDTAGEMEDLQPGATLGPYRIEAVVAHGGMGTVYRATQEPLGRTVALKVIASNLARDPDFRSRFQREARLAASIEHPNLVALFEAGEEDGVLYMAMQFVEGSDLSHALEAESWLEPPRAVRLIEQVAAALDRAHASGLVHRDVKPANVLLGEVDGAEWAYLTDFGLTKAAASGSELTGSGQWIGTLDYASPEQIQDGRVDARSDVYSLGCVLYELLTGRIPFERDDEVAKLWAHVNAPPPRPSEAVEGLPAGMDEVISRSLAKSPADRHPSAGDLARAARAALEGTEVSRPERSVATGRAAGGGARTRVMLRERARPPVLIGAAVVALVIAALAAILLLPGGDSPTVAATIDVGEAPVALTHGEGGVWVSDEGAGTLTRIDPATDEVAAPAIEIGGSPRGVAIGEGRVWVTDSARDQLARVDPSSDPPGVEARIGVGGEPSGVAVGKGLVWVSNLADESVSRVKPGGQRRFGKQILVGTAPAGIAIGSGSDPSIWVALSGGGRVARLSPSGDLVARIDVGAKPRGIAVGADRVWVSNSLDGSVTRIDTAGEVVGEATGVGTRPAGIAVGEGYVWVANTEDGTVSRLDPDSGEKVGDDIEVGERPRGVAVGAGSVWVANSGDGTVTRIDP
jgi:DNA-binding beta-propeller fold protein YncE